MAVSKEKKMDTIKTFPRLVSINKHTKKFEKGKFETVERGNGQLYILEVFVYILILLILYD